MSELRSSCPINYGLEIFGDQWSLLILRDLIFNNKNTYGEFLESAEGISTNILAKRLVNLENAELIAKGRHPSNKKTFIYNLTEKGETLIPVLLELIIWGANQTPKNKGLLAWANQISKDKAGAIVKAKMSARQSLEDKIQPKVSE
jgi:DNA-binding HxlR family transcriptional regulator